MYTLFKNAFSSKEIQKKKLKKKAVYNQNKALLLH